LMRLILFAFEALSYLVLLRVCLRQAQAPVKVYESIEA